MLARALFVLVTTISTTSWADGSVLVVKYQSFRGENCALVPDSVLAMTKALYIDRDFSEKIVAPLKLNGSKELETRSLQVPVAAIPESRDEEKLSFRFYALHPNNRANQYQVLEAITRELVDTLPEGLLQTKQFATYIYDERGNLEKSNCTLTLQLLKTN